MPLPLHEHVPDLHEHVTNLPRILHLGGSLVAAGGGGLAGTSEDPSIAHVGLGVGITGLILGVAGYLVQFARMLFADRQSGREFDRRLIELSAKVKQQDEELSRTKLELDGSRQRRHADANRANAIINQQELRIRLLSASVSSNSDAVAINAAALRKLGEASGVAIETVAPAPPLIDPGSDMDFAAFADGLPQPPLLKPDVPIGGTPPGGLQAAQAGQMGQAPAPPTSPVPPAYPASPPAAPPPRPPDGPGVDRA